MTKPTLAKSSIQAADASLTQAILELTSDGILISDLDLRVIAVSAGFRGMWDFPAEGGTQLATEQVWQPIARRFRDAPGHLARLREIEVSREDSFDLLETKNGQFYERSSRPLWSEAKVTGRIWQFRDVTQSHQIDLISRRLAAIVESSDDAIIGKDLQSIITSWNAGAERIFGYTAEEMVGASIMKLIPADRRTEEEEILARIGRGERFEHFETIRMTKNGKFLHVSLTVSPIKNGLGQVVGASKIARDITERKAVEDALTRAKEEAEETIRQRQRLVERERAARSDAERASRMKDEFLANLSHELRTPLNAILGWATVLRSERLTGIEREQGIDTIERNARAQAQIIDDLLDMSRIISGKVRLEVQRLDLSAVLVESIDTVRTAAEAKGIQLKTVIGSQNASITGDPSRLQQVFWNLLNNAIKFTPKDGLVQIVLRRVDSHVEISFSDNGEGIAEEFLPHIFNRFQQADATSTRKHGGLGLGLAIVKQLVELHGGRVLVQSDGRGQGATFLVELPLAVLQGAAEDAELPQAHAASRASQPLSTMNLQGIRVLVIDDEPDARGLLQRLLEMAGAKAAQASSAADGLDYLSREPVDVVICDIGMPEEDGYSFVRKLRALDDQEIAGTAAIALTAYARLQDRTEAIRSGFQNHLAKPVEPAELLAVVQRLALSRRGS